jgi:hypothetical protein
MSMTVITEIPPSEFIGRKDIEYFDFEEDFVENNIRCIPMIVRFKMDKAGIKLRLDEWSKFSVNDRIQLAKRKCDDAGQVADYYHYTTELIYASIGRQATLLAVDMHPAWQDINRLPVALAEKLNELRTTLSLGQWRLLTSLQRFALIKLCRPGHENRNFPIALKEFGLT